MATNQTATATGYDGAVTWALPDTTGVQGQQVLLADNGSSTDCSSVAYTTTVVTGLAPTATSYTDANRTASSGAGDQFCYAVESYWTTNSWYELARAPATQLGLVVDSVAIQNGGGASGTLDTGDTITVTFNQQPATPASADLCTFNTGLILIGDSSCVATTDTFAIGELSGLTVGGKGHQKRTSSVSITSSAPWVMTVTVGQNGAKVSGSGTFTPSSSLVSAATTDQATACGSGNCVPTPTGGF